MTGALEPPLVAGPLCGLRAWGVRWTPQGDRLTGPYVDTAWPVHAGLSAECSASHHAAPHGCCSCGIYGWHPTSQSATTVCHEEGFEAATVAGIVAAWGAVEVHADGFRAANGRPHTLLIPEDADPQHAARISRLADSYGAATLMGGPDELLAHCRNQALGLDAQATTELLGPLAAHEQRRQRRGETRRTATAWIGAITSIALLVGAARSWPTISDALHADPVAIAPEVHALHIVSEHVIDQDDGTSAYIAVVRNEHPTKTALGVFTAGTLRRRDGGRLAQLGNRLHFDLRPVIAPGDEAVAVDVIDDTDTLAAKIRHYRTTPLARAFRTGTGGARVRITRATVDQRRCLVEATLTSDRQRLSAGVVILAFGKRRRLDWAQRANAGPLPAGPSRQVLLRISPGACRRHIATLAVYPDLTYDQAIPRR